MTLLLTFKTLQWIWKAFNRDVEISSLNRFDIQNVRTKVFIGTSSLFRRTFILLTSVTSCDERFSSISLLTPSKSRHLVTPFDALREECGDNLIVTLPSEDDLRRHLQCFSVEHSTNNDPFFQFCSVLGLSGHTNQSLLISKK